MKPGDIVIAAFPGAQVTKSRPAVVLSTVEYHQHRPDVILGLITTRFGRSHPTDCDIQDWQAAGLHSPSRFRLYLVTLLQTDVRIIGRLTPRDWKSVTLCVSSGLVGNPPEEL